MHIALHFGGNELKIIIIEHRSRTSVERRERGNRPLSNIRRELSKKARHKPAKRERERETT